MLAATVKAATGRNPDARREPGELSSCGAILSDFQGSAGAARLTVEKRCGYVARIGTWAAARTGRPGAVPLTRHAPTCW